MPGGPKILPGVLDLLVLLALCEVRLPVSWRTPLSVEQLVLGYWLLAGGFLHQLQGVSFNWSPPQNHKFF